MGRVDLKGCSKIRDVLNGAMVAIPSSLASRRFNCAVDLVVPCLSFHPLPHNITRYTESACTRKKFAPTSLRPCRSPNSRAFQLLRSSSAAPYSGAPSGTRKPVVDGGSWKSRNAVSRTVCCVSAMWDGARGTNTYYNGGCPRQGAGPAGGRALWRTLCSRRPAHQNSGGGLLSECRHHSKERTRIRGRARTTQCRNER
jgi:hypothetical protein